MTGDPIVPPVDRDTAEWWESTRRQRLVLQTCLSCGHLQHYPRALCTACGGEELGWSPASGRATVLSHTTVHRAPSPAFSPPYVLALVRLEEGPQLLTAVEGAVRCEDAVTLAWRPLPDGRHLPVFRSLRED